MKPEKIFSVHMLVKSWRKEYCFWVQEYTRFNLESHI